MQKIKQEFKRILFNYRNREKKAIIHPNVIFNNKTILHGNNVIYHNTQINDSVIGYGTYISKNCRLPNSIIGNFCCIGSDVKIVFGQHPIKKYVSMHPAFYSTKRQAGFTYVSNDKFEEHKYVNKESKKSISIGNDVWIGQNVLIMEGVQIADGSVIGSGAIVTKDTEPFSINLGIPAQIRGYRFSEEQRQFLSTIKWWENCESWLIENNKYFEDVELFYAKFGDC
ncbi:CatB-related O-acetyltransferase [Gottfriedia sp. NPDC058432]|uniref:CatB-related O-acetyltransferase n=1 Tax=Gottfriedia sp. NPDC058432 TaxID=3346497 RepID=UPI0036612356